MQINMMFWFQRNAEPKNRKQKIHDRVYIYVFINPSKWSFSCNYHITYYNYTINKGNNKITELRTIFQSESQNS